MNKTVSICMIGAGRVGKNHSNSITGYIPNAQITALVDPAEEVLRSTGDEFGVEQRFTSLEEALDKVDFNAVVITTPTFTHRDLVLQAADAGKHVFLEKPMALNLDECDAIISGIQKAGVILQIGFMRRFDPDFVEASRRIAAGEIGDPMMVKSNTHGPGLPPAWARDLSRSNGMLAEVNSHDWDTVRWLMNSELDRVYTEVANFKGAESKVDTPNFYDNVLVNIRFQSGGLGLISGICPCGYGYDARVEIVGTKGIMQIGELKGKAVLVCTNRDQGLVTPIYRTWPDRFKMGYIGELRHFVDCILNEKEPSVGGEEGRWAVAGVLAATKSMLENRPVYLNEIL
ncbi:MAG: oxidoreductase [Anaerolineaceae bacterium]|jgi:myo-inositol 2-dehydrogenase/D-chiro-inositol 1-dehydrogenase/scyllo-inositol 2-dehydrogenase (NAD+)|nr:MAG: oxidoreductase [Anaerolineaceae bacterium]